MIVILAVDAPIAREAVPKAVTRRNEAVTVSAKQPKCSRTERRNTLRLERNLRGTGLGRVPSLQSSASEVAQEKFAKRADRAAA